MRVSPPAKLTQLPERGKNEKGLALGGERSEGPSKASSADRGQAASKFIDYFNFLSSTPS